MQEQERADALQTQLEDMHRQQVTLQEALLAMRQEQERLMQQVHQQQHRGLDRMDGPCFTPYVPYYCHGEYRGPGQYDAGQYDATAAHALHPSKVHQPSHGPESTTSPARPPRHHHRHSHQSGYNRHHKAYHHSGPMYETKHKGHKGAHFGARPAPAKKHVQQHASAR